MGVGETDALAVSPTLLAAECASFAGAVLRAADVLAALLTPLLPEGARVCAVVVVGVGETGALAVSFPPTEGEEALGAFAPVLRAAGTLLLTTPLALSLPEGACACVVVVVGETDAPAGLFPPTEGEEAVGVGALLERSTLVPTPAFLPPFSVPLTARPWLPPVAPAFATARMLSVLAPCLPDDAGGDDFFANPRAKGMSENAGDRGPTGA